MKKFYRYSRILLINLPGTVQDGYMPTPLGILYLASYLRKYLPNLKINIVDGALLGTAEIYKKVKSFRPDLVGLSVLTPGRIEAVNITKKIKIISPNCHVVLGGIHPTIMWQQMMQHYPFIDFIVKGEGEVTLSKLIQNMPFSKIKGLVWRNVSKIINNPPRPLIKNINNIPFPAWDLINPLKYPPRGQGVFRGIDLGKEVRFPVIFSRGCMGACTFCSTWKIWQGYRCRKGQNVAREIALLSRTYHAKHFVFQDDTLTGNRREMIIFCREIIKRKLNVALIGCTRVDHVDFPLLKLMKKAGFYELSFGIETGSPSLLKTINKNTNIENIITAAQKTKNSGIRFTALMMSNLPNETIKDKQLSQKLLEKIQPDNWSTLGCVWIFPGTAIYHQAKNAGIISDSFWLSRRPYYIYRGGIGRDPIQYEKLVDDWYQIYKNTFLGKLFYQLYSHLSQNLKLLCYNSLRFPLSI